MRNIPRFYIKGMVDVRMVCEKAQKTHVDSKWVTLLATQENSVTLLCCYIAFLGKRENYAAIQRVRELMQDPAFAHIAIPAFIKAAEPGDMLLLALPQAFTTTIAAIQEDLVLELLDIPTAPLTEVHILNMASKGLYKALAKARDHKLLRLDQAQEKGEEQKGNVQGASNSYMTIECWELIPTTRETWTAGRMLRLLLKRNIFDEAVVALLQSWGGCEESVIVLLRYKKHKLAKHVALQAGLMKSADLLKTALEQQAVNFIITLIAHSEGELHGDIDYFFNRLLLCLRGPRHLWSLYLYMLKLYLPLMPANIARQLLEFVSECAEDLEPSTTFVLDVCNPIKIALCLYELVQLVGKQFDSMQRRASIVCEELERLLVALAGELKQEEAVVEFYRDVDFKGRDVIAIICQLGLTDLFLNRHVEKLAWDFWNGSGHDFPLFFQPTSSLFSLLLFKMQKREDYEAEQRRATYRRDMTQMRPQRVQFMYWRDGVHFRYLFDMFVAFTMAALVYGIIQASLVWAQGPSELFLTCYQMGTCTANDYARVRDDIYKGMLASNVVLAMTFLTSFLLIDHIVKACYSLYVRRKLYIDWSLFVLDTLLIGVNIVFLSKYFREMTVNNRPASSDEELMLRFAQAGDTTAQVWLATYVFLLCIRVLMFFSISSYIGPFLKSLQVMIVAVWHFILVYVTLLLTFALVFNLLNAVHFQANFNSFSNSLITLFQSALGVFDLNLLPNDIAFKTYYMLFLVICSIMLLNVLVALLTQVHDSYRTRGTGLYFYELFKLRELYAPDPAYEYLVHTAFPLSVIVCVVGVPISLLLPSPSKQRFCRWVLYAEYTFAFMFVLLLYVAVEAFLYPLAYLKCILHKTMRICIATTETRISKLLTLLLFIVVGPLILLGNLLADIVYFTRQCYTPATQEVLPVRLLTRTDVPMSVYEEVFGLLERDKRAKVGLKELRDGIRHILGLSAPRLVVPIASKATETKPQNIGKAFVLSSLLSFFENIAEEDCQGQRLVDIQRSKSLLRENLLIPQLRAKYIKKQARKNVPTKTAPKEGTGYAESKNDVGSSTLHGLTQPSVPPQKVAMNVLRWHRSEVWKKAFMGQTSKSDAFINEMRELNHTLAKLSHPHPHPHAHPHAHAQAQPEPQSQSARDIRFPFCCSIHSLAQISHTKLALFPTLKSDTFAQHSSIWT